MFHIQDYYSPKTIEEATEILADKPDLVVIAGGTDVLIRMHGGSIEKAGLLSLRDIKSLEEIKLLPDGTIAIGALATFSQVNKNQLIKEKIPVLAQAAITMGGPQIRNSATIGGNICNGATSGDSASTLFALNAKLKLKCKGNERIVPIQEFYLGPGKVALEKGEILQEILVAKEDYQGFHGYYTKFSMRKAMDIATLGVAVLVKLQDKGTFSELRIGLGVAGPTPIRCLEAEEFARGKSINGEIIKEISKLAVKTTKARTSWRASKEYREHLVEELCQRGIKKVVSENGGVEVV